MNKTSVKNVENKNTETFEDIECYLIIIMIEIGIIIFYKLIALCSKGYKVHNKIIIDKNNKVNPILS